MTTLQQFRAGLFRGPEPEHSAAQPRRQSDQYRSELEYRQAELRLEQLKKQIRIEVRNAQYALEQSRARVEAAQKARDLASSTFDITRKEQQLGAGSNFQTLTAQRDLAVAELDLVNCDDGLSESEDRIGPGDRHDAGAQRHFEFRMR